MSFPFAPGRIFQSVRLSPVIGLWPYTIVLLCLLHAALAEGQPVQYRFQHFTSENGLPQNSVYDICQDKYGFMWFSTKNGVCRYDGYRTLVYKPTDHFAQDVVDLSQCIEADNNGHMVFGTGAGFYFIDLETDSISRRVLYGTEDSTDTNINNIFSLSVEGDVIWAGTGNGLLRYDQGDGSLRYFNALELCPAFKGKRLWIKNLLADGKGALWMTTNEGLLKMQTGNFKTEMYNATATQPFYVNNSYFSSVAFDKKGRIWAGTLRKGVYCFDFTKQTIDSINFTGLTDSSENYNEIKRMICDSKGMVWAATQYGGLVRIDPDTKQIQRIRSNVSSPFSLASDLISGLYEDRSGILWVGTYNSGVDRTSISGSRFINIPYASTDSSCFSIKAVECFAEQGDTLLWVGTMQGLFLFDKRNHSCRRFEDVTDNKIPLPHQSVAGLEWDENGLLWIGTRSDVLLCVDIQNVSYKQYCPDTTSPLLKGSTDFRTVVRTHSGELYFSFDNRILRYDKAADSLVAVVDRDSLLLQVRRVNRLSVDERFLFVASDLEGLMKLDLTTNILTPVVSPDPQKDRLSQNVLIRKFSDGRYVLTDFKGLYLLDKEFVFGRLYSDKDGLSDNKIVNTHIDASGKVWMATFNGLSVFDTAAKSFVNYYMQDGLMENEFREAKALGGRHGLLYFPTSKGFTYFDPLQVNPAGSNVAVFFTGFRILDKEISFGKNLNNIKELSVPPGSNFFTVTFSTTGYNTVQPSAFAYMLEGVDRDWVVTTSNAANYTNIDGGEYIFRVKPLNSAAGERTLRITVGTVFYKTWWFRSLLLAMLLFLIFSFVRFRENLIMKKESAKIIDYFANSHYGSNSVEEILWDVCRNCISRLGFEDAVVYMLDPSTKLLVQKAAYGPKNPKDYEIADPIDIPVGYGIVGSAARSGKPELITDTTKDHRYIADDRHRMSELAVPIIYEGKVIGVIDSEHSQKGFFNSEHVRLLSTIASICSTKIAKAQSDQEAAERERRLLEIGKKVAETRLMALRAQMNPHFIFNSLNSIQECIVNEKIEEAHKYLSQFSRLLRLVIDYSEQNLISLDKEIEFLNLYLGLESVRFGKSFSYDITVDPLLDEEETRVPSLLIQPFAENAIWHGLLHKNGDRKLMITFKVSSGDHLLCVVEDNGIGRIKAAEIKAQRMDAQNHESKGMRISQERLDLLRLQTDLDPGIEIQDLYDAAGQPSGTRVTVTLPLEMDNQSLDTK